MADNLLYAAIAIVNAFVGNKSVYQLNSRHLRFGPAHFFLIFPSRYDLGIKWHNFQGFVVGSEALPQPKEGDAAANDDGVIRNEVAVEDDAGIVDGKLKGAQGG